MKSVNESVLFQRAELVLGRAALERIAARRVIVFGLGGVGSWCAEALARTGFRRLTLVDSDVVCATNVNRQAQATARNIGAPKAEELRRRLLEINPHADIAAVRAAFDERTCGQFDLAQYDCVVDAIDSLKNKVLLIERCVQANVKCYASMGAAAKTDPGLIRTGSLARTQMCPLAKWVRKRLRKRGIGFKNVQCVYSLEPPREPLGAPICGTDACCCAPAGATADEAHFPDWCARKAQVNGALVHITAIFGFTLAGMIIRDMAADGSRKTPDILPSVTAAISPAPGRCPP